MASVYIETTIPSFYYTSRKSVQALAWHKQTRHWWDHLRHKYTLVTSTAVIDELEQAPPERAAPRLALLEGVTLLQVDPRVDGVVAEYIAHHLMPDDGGRDAVHVALASVHAVDFVLTWNCTHLANVNKARHLTTINARLGLLVPALVTPYYLT